MSGIYIYREEMTVILFLFPHCDGYRIYMEVTSSLNSKEKACRVDTLRSCPKEEFKVPNMKV